MFFSKEKGLGIVDRVMNKLVPEGVGQTQADAAVSEKRFQKMSREIKILTARNIIQQIREREASQGKLSAKEIGDYVVQKSTESGWKEDRIMQDITGMVMKLYHLGSDLPDHEL